MSLSLKPQFAGVLEAFLRTSSEQFTAAKPFGHIVFDGLFAPQMVTQIHRLFFELPELQKYPPEQGPVQSAVLRPSEEP